MAVNTLVFDRGSYKNVVCLGHILAEDGQKMSKHLGNIQADPAHGRARRRRRAVVHGRIGLALGGAPRGTGGAAGDRAQGAADLLEHRRLPGALRPARRMAPHVDNPSPPLAERPALDRWALSEAHRLVTPAALEEFDATGGVAVSGYVDQLSLVRPTLAPQVLGRRPCGAGYHCTSASTWSRC